MARKPQAVTIGLELKANPLAQDMHAVKAEHREVEIIPCPAHLTCLPEFGVPTEFFAEVRGAGMDKHGLQLCEWLR